MKRKIKDNQIGLGLTFGIVGMATYGLFPVFSNYIVKTLDPLIFAVLSTLIGSFPLVLGVKLKGHQDYLFGNPKYFGRLFALAMLSGFANLLFFLGTNLTT